VLKCVFTSVRAAAYLFLRARGYARMHEISADSGRGCGYVHVADSGHGRGVQYAGANLCRKYPRGYYPLPSLSAGLFCEVCIYSYLFKFCDMYT
jgi:hypothetical protein